MILSLPGMGKLMGAVFIASTGGDMDAFGSADLHAATARRGGDPEVTALITELSGLSQEFADEWARHDVEFRRNDRKRLIHPDLGLLEVNCLNLYSEDGRQRLLWFTPATGTDSVAKLELLAVLGTQDFAP